MLFLVGRKILVKRIYGERLFFTVLDTETIEASIRVHKPTGFMQDSCECGRSQENNFCKHVAAGVLLLNKYHYFDNTSSTMQEVLPADIAASPRETPDLKLVDPASAVNKEPAKSAEEKQRQKVQMREYLYNDDDKRSGGQKSKQMSVQIGSQPKPVLKPKPFHEVYTPVKKEDKSAAAENEKLLERLAGLIPQQGREIKTANKKLIFVFEETLGGAVVSLEKAEYDPEGSLNSKGRAQNRDAVYMPKPDYETVMLLDFFFSKGSRFDIGQKIFEFETFSSAKQYVPEYFLLPAMVEKILEFEHIYKREKDTGKLLPLEIENEPYTASLDMQQHKGNTLLKLTIERGELRCELDDLRVLLLEPLTCLYGNKVVRIAGLNNKQLNFFKNSANTITIPKGNQQFVEETLLPGLAGYINITGMQTIKKSEVEELRKGILLGENDTALGIKLVFSYDGSIVHYDPYKEREVLREKEGLTVVSRNKEFEQEAYRLLMTYPLKEIETGVFLPRHDPVLFLHERLEHLKQDGFDIYGEKDLKKLVVRRETPTLSLSVNSRIDWFDVRGTVRFGEHTVSLDQLLTSVKEGKQYVHLEDNSIGVLPEQWVRKFVKTLPMSRRKDDALVYTGSQTLLIDELLSEAEDVTIDKEYGERVERLKNFKGIQEQPIPDGIPVNVREYQKTGYSWFYFLKEFKFGGILADDMGLGKTLQVLMLLKNEKKSGLQSPVLIVCPTSLVFNWINESEKFNTGLKFLKHTGTDRDDISQESIAGYDVIITTYGILLNDAEALKAISFHYIILDESQKIKNPLSKTAKAAYSLNGSYRLCMTGTPIENNLTELWSQFHFVNPGMFSTLHNFKSAYITPIQKFNDSSALETLKKTTYPFILRRTKEVVASELPEKSEIIHYCEMEEEQRALYEFWRDSIKLGVLKTIEKKGLRNSHIKVLEGLLRLRQICNHPYLIGEKDVKKSGKFDEFRRLIEPIVEENHKILVFSQFTKMLEIMRRGLEKKKMPYALLTGSTADREGEVKKFQEDEKTKIFLISLKAGGFGLNLTAADYVIHYDPWWNPAAEAQATDRAHRIGQDKSVFVYKMITRETVEEKIIQMQERKKNLAGSVLSLEKGGMKNLTMDDIAELFG